MTKNSTPSQLLIMIAMLYTGHAQLTTCRISEGWLPSGTAQCLLVSTEKNQDTLTWDDAKNRCNSLHPGASLASLPTDAHDNNLASRLNLSTPYWIGMKTSVTNTQNLVWLDKSPENRPSFFNVSTTVMNSGSTLCGHVTLIVITLQPPNFDILWTLDDCNVRHPYVCLMDESMSTATLPNPGATTTKQDDTTTTVNSSSIRVPPTAFSSYLFTFIKDQLQCHVSSPVDCLLDAVNSTAQQAPSQAREQALLTSSRMLIDELSNIVVKEPNVNYLMVLSDFLHVLDALLEVSFETRNTLAQQKIDDVLAKAEDFLDNVMTTAETSGLDPEHRLTLAHIDLLVTRSNYGNIRGKRLRMKSGEITIDAIHPSIHFNGTVTARAVISVLVLEVPKTEVWLTHGEEMVRALVVSPVLSLSAVVNHFKASLSHTFSLTVEAIQNSTNQPVCGYQSSNGSEEVWDIQGCQALGDHLLQVDNISRPVNVSFPTPSRATNSSNNNSTNSDSDLDGDPDPDYVECHCNHTTNFAILMQVSSFQLNARDKLALSTITYIGCSITLVTQVMAITVFTCVRSLNSERVCVHRNLCIAIMLAQVTFISGIKAVKDKIVCAFVALILHYLYTASFVWMLVEGLHLYSKVVRVFGTEKSRIIYYMCFGWGVPLVLVAISAAVDWEGYGTSNSCWLSSERSTIWAFIGPAVAIMIVNFVILVAVLRIVVSSAKVDKHHDSDHIRAGAKATLFLIPLLGLTWMFGLAAVNKDLVVFQYIFAILNSLQGFFIFLCHCVFNSEVRQTLKRLREKRSLQKGEFATTSSTTNGRPSSSESRYENKVSRKGSTSPVFRKTNTVAPSPGQTDNRGNGQTMPPMDENGDLTLMYI